MSTPRILETNVQFWLTSSAGEINEYTTLYPTTYDMEGEGWILVEKRKIVVEIDQDALVLKQVAALREQAQKVRADAEMKAQRFEDMAQKLLALPAPAGSPCAELLDANTFAKQTATLHHTMDNDLSS